MFLNHIKNVATNLMNRLKPKYHIDMRITCNLLKYKKLQQDYKIKTKFTAGKIQYGKIPKIGSLLLHSAQKTRIVYM